MQQRGINTTLTFNNFYTCMYNFWETAWETPANQSVCQCANE